MPEISDRLDARIVTIPCYEPAGFEIHLTGRTLCTHTLLLGQTGSGKSSILRWFEKGIIQNRDSRCGIFIFDLNGDDTVNLVRRWAGEAARSDDVRLLTPTTGHLELFHNVRSFDDLSFATSHFMQGWNDESENAYWRETTRLLIDTALTICFTTGTLNTDTVIRFLTNWLISRQKSAEDEALLKSFVTILKEAPKHLDKITLSKLQLAHATLEMWIKLDDRTRGILNSCLLSTLGPLIAPETRKYVDADRGRLFSPEEILDGKILVFSLPSGRHLESARFLGKIIKARLYVALQERKQDRNQPLCAVVADEYHYLASGGVERASDVTALATLRSRNVALIAATQSLDHLASVMGARDFRSLVPNFGSQFFLRSTESTTGAFATATMGTRRVVARAVEEHGDLQIEQPPRLTMEWVCPPGALARLEPCRTYIALADGYRSDGPVWCAGNYDQPTSVLPRQKKADEKSPVDSLKALREIITQESVTSPGVSSASSDPEVAYPSNPGDESDMKYSLPMWERLLKEKRFQRTGFSSFDNFYQAIAKHGHRPDGLERLPICWWDAVARLTDQLKTVPGHHITGMMEVLGDVFVSFAGSTLPDHLRDWVERLRLSLYPIRTRKLKMRDAKLVIDEHDDVEIFGKRSQTGDTRP